MNALNKAGVNFSKVRPPDDMPEVADPDHFRLIVAEP